MISFKTAKANFFDRAKVMAAADKATRNVLSKFGAYVRRSAKDLIRKRKGSAPPGSPPNSHTGLLRNFIFFSWDEAKRSVVIGPTKLNAKNSRAPELLEHGGTDQRKAKTIYVKVPSGTRKVDIPARQVVYRARPFMQPAFDKNLPTVPDMWANAINKAR